MRPFAKILSVSFIFLLVFFLFIFPKGGFKVEGVPITWGYLLLALVGLALTFRSYHHFQLLRTYSYLSLIPFQLLSLFSICYSGITSTGFFISFLVSFIFLPFLFYFVLSGAIEALPMNQFYSIFKKGMLFVAAYGIFLFIYKLVTKEFLEIPFLTINYHDLGEIENKHINRGMIFKLISTYNNGNLYGASLLLLLPLYNYLESSLMKRIIVKSSLFLTLSRTVWLGFIFSELLYHFWITRKNQFLFLKNLIRILFFGFTLALVAFFCNLSSAFFFDLNLGGRAGQLENFQYTFLGLNHPFRGIMEMVYVSVLQNFGLFGLISFLLGLVAPLLLSLLFRSSLSPLHRCLASGLMSYLFICLSDGAILLIPVMAIYWFVSSLFLRNKMESEQTGLRAMLPSNF